jgi:hypothetical protein
LKKEFVTALVLILFFDLEDHSKEGKTGYQRGT